jgi:hypothetical protein
LLKPISSTKMRVGIASAVVTFICVFSFSLLLSA